MAQIGFQQWLDDSNKNQSDKILIDINDLNEDNMKVAVKHLIESSFLIVEQLEMISAILVNNKQVMDTNRNEISVLVKSRDDIIKVMGNIVETIKTMKGR
ncbi:MAG: hypothetical protein ABIJ16_08445 [Bacteroidota bacterium]